MMMEGQPSHKTIIVLIVAISPLSHRMAQVVAFQAALTRLGFAQPAIATLDANGLTGVRDLINLTKKDVEQLLKIVRASPPPVVVPFLAQKRLNIFCYWATK